MAKIEIMAFSESQSFFFQGDSSPFLLVVCHAVLIYIRLGLSQKT